MLSVKNLKKVYKLGKGKNAKEVVALDGVSIDFPEKGLVFLLGKSGSGKSTLLNAIGGLDTFDEGEIIIKGKSSKSFKQSDFDSYRNTFIGFIFQEYNILDEFSVGKNLALALELQAKKFGKQEVENLLKEVDLEGFYKRKPNQLSGGQKQRVAIARALIKDPEIIMADEPTGALDSNTGKQVMETLKKLSKQKLVIIVSHDREFAHLYGDRVIELKDGKIISDTTKKEVEAEKTASGVSFIENKIVHIKKGQKLSPADLDKINKLLVSNTKDADTIISFDSNTNSEVKKAAFITDDGNQQVFSNTLKEDVKQKQYSAKDFKLIHSRLKIKDAFKMGASSLKHKPFRLIFTILLACIAFTMFGVVDTFASFNRPNSVYESVQLLNLKNIPIVRNLKEEHYVNEDVFNDAQLNRFSNKFKNNTFVPVIAANNYHLNIGSSDYRSGPHNIDTLNSNFISGIMALDQNVENTFNLQIVDGRMPVGQDEVCISLNLFNFFKSKNIAIELNTTLARFTAYSSGTDLPKLKIVGVVKDDTDVSRYQNLTQDDGFKESLNNRSVRATLLYGLVNMCYVSPNLFESLKNSYTSGSKWLYCKSATNSGTVSISFSDILTYSSFYSEYIQNAYDPSYYTPTMKDGCTVENLSGNQIVISTSLMRQLDLNFDAIKQGATCTFRVNDEISFSFEIVGYYETSGYNFIVSNQFFKENVANFNYILTRLNGHNDKELINYVETARDGHYNFAVQFPPTELLDSFSETIEEFSKYMIYIGIGLAVFAGLMLMNFISISIVYKKREIGILRAIGARGRDVFSIFFAESFIICLINFFISAILTGVACFAINHVLLTRLGLTVAILTFGIRQILLLFAVSFLVALVASFFPVNRIARKNPIDSINNR